MTRPTIPSAACASRTRSSRRSRSTTCTARRARAATPGAGAHDGRRAQQEPLVHQGGTDSGKAVGNDDFQRIIGLLETRDADAMVLVAQFLASTASSASCASVPTGKPGTLLAGRRVHARGLRLPAHLLHFDREALQACATPDTAAPAPTRSSTPTSSRRPGRTPKPCATATSSTARSRRATGACSGLRS